VRLSGASGDAAIELVTLTRSGSIAKADGSVGRSRLKLFKQEEREPVVGLGEPLIATRRQVIYVSRPTGRPSLAVLFFGRDVDQAFRGEIGKMLPNGHGSEFKRPHQRIDAGVGLAFEMMEDSLSRAMHKTRSRTGNPHLADIPQRHFERMESGETVSRFTRCKP